MKIELDYLILKLELDRGNIVTHVYDMFTSFYNAGVEGLGFDDAHNVY